MSSLEMNLSTYRSILKSPVSPSMTNPISSMIYNSTTSKIFSDTFAKKLNTTMASYLTTMNKVTNDLKTSAKDLSSKALESVFDKKTVKSSDESISGTIAANANAEPFQVKVSQLAASQVNTGVALKSAEETTFNQGINSFKLKVGSTEKTISFTINNQDTNKTSLDKMASAINYSKAGVTANVVTDAKNGTSYLKLTGDKTGKSNAFQLSDPWGSNVIAKSGISNIASEAKNAEYAIDGKAYSSDSNTIRFGNGLGELTFKKAENKDISVSIDVDSKAMKDSIHKFVENYNKTVDFLKTNGDQFEGAGKLFNEVYGIVKMKKSSLLEAGIKTESDGKLTVDDRRLDKAITDSAKKVKDIFYGSHGIANKMVEKASDVITSPLQYTRPTEITSFNSRSLYQKNSYYAGMLLDMIL